MNHHFNGRRLMNLAGRKRGLTGCSRDTLHKVKEITLIKSSKIRWFSWWSGSRGWSLLSEVKSLKTTKRAIRLESSQIRWFSWWLSMRLDWCPSGWSRAFFLKLKPRGLSGSSPFRSDSSRDSQTGGWTGCPVVKDAQMRVGKQL